MKTQQHQLHIDKINAAIDSIIELEQYYSQTPNDLSKALTKLNELRDLAEEEIEVGDKVYDSFNHQTSIVNGIHEKNLSLDSGFVGVKFCFKSHY